MKEDPFSVLGVSKNASRDEIKAAYHRLCLQFHPDKQPPHEKQNAKRVFSRIAEAYNFLSMYTCLYTCLYFALFIGAPNRLPYTANASSFARVRKPRISNIAVASILGLPVVFSAVFLGMRYEQIKNQTGRHGGLLNPPINPFLRPRRGHGFAGQSFDHVSRQQE